MSTLAEQPRPGKARPVTLGGRRFRSKAALLRHLRRTLLGRRPVGPLKGADKRLVLALWESYPHRPVRCPLAVAASVVPTPGGNRCLAVRLLDGSEYLLSAREAVWPSTEHERLSDALRGAVSDQVAEAKTAWWESGDRRCAITGELLAIDEAEVDHDEPRFHQLVSAFLRVYPGEVELVGGRLDPEVANLFAAVHETLAKLRVVGGRANRSRPPSTVPQEAVDADVAAVLWEMANPLFDDEAA